MNIHTPPPPPIEALVSALSFYNNFVNWRICQGHHKYGRMQIILCTRQFCIIRGLCFKTVKLLCCHPNLNFPVAILLVVHHWCTTSDAILFLGLLGFLISAHGYCQHILTCHILRRLSSNCSSITINFFWEFFFYSRKFIGLLYFQI